MLLLGPIVEIGSLVINGSARDIFDGCGETYTGVDIRPGRGVDVVADGAEYKHPEPVDLFVCCEVLEHVDNDKAKAIMRNIADNLDIGGYLIVTCAAAADGKTRPGRAPHSVDGGPLGEGEFYRNVKFGQLRRWATEAGLFVEELERHGTDLRMLAINLKNEVVEDGEGVYDDDDDSDDEAPVSLSEALTELDND